MPIRETELDSGAASGVGKLGQPDLLGSILSRPASQARNLAAHRVGRAGQAVERDRVAVVVEDQEGRLLHEHPRDVVEPEIGTAEQAAGPAQVEPVDRPTLAQQVPQVAAPEVAQSARLPRSWTDALVSLRCSGEPSR